MHILTLIKELDGNEFIKGNWTDTKDCIRLWVYLSVV